MEIMTDRHGVGWQDLPRGKDIGCLAVLKIMQMWGESVGVKVKRLFDICSWTAPWMLSNTGEDYCWPTGNLFIFENYNSIVF